MTRSLLLCLSGMMVLLAACGDFDEFDRRVRQGAADSPDRRIIITPNASDAGVLTTDGTPQLDSGLPEPDSTTPPKTDIGGTAPPTGQCGMNSFEEQVFILVNQQRQQQGLTAYQCDAKAVKVARDYSALMCSTGHFSHYGPDGSTPWQRLTAGGVSYSTAGENIAAGQSTPQSVMTAWMNSSGHRANILSSSFTHIGVGYDTCGQGYNHYWTQSFFRP